MLAGTAIRSPEGVLAYGRTEGRDAVGKLRERREGEECRCLEDLMIVFMCIVCRFMKKDSYITSSITCSLLSPSLPSTSPGLNHQADLCPHMELSVQESSSRSRILKSQLVLQLLQHRDPVATSHACRDALNLNPPHLKLLRSVLGGRRASCEVDLHVE